MLRLDFNKADVRSAPITVTGKLLSGKGQTPVRSSKKERERKHVVVQHFLTVSIDEIRITFYFLTTKRLPLKLIAQPAAISRSPITQLERLAQDVSQSLY